jgi:hypothetical protein
MNSWNDCGVTRAGASARARRAARASAGASVGAGTALGAARHGRGHLVDQGVHLGRGGGDDLDTAGGVGAAVRQDDRVRPQFLADPVHRLAGARRHISPKTHSILPSEFRAIRFEGTVACD